MRIIRFRLARFIVEYSIMGYNLKFNSNNYSEFCEFNDT